MTITPKEYTKHYYMNGERVANSIGGGGLCAMSPDVISNTETHHEEYLSFNSSAQEAVNAGLLPCTLFRQQYIHFPQKRNRK